MTDRALVVASPLVIPPIKLPLAPMPRTHLLSCLSFTPLQVGLGANNSVLAVGGIQAYLKGQPDVNFFNVTDAAAPEWFASADPPLVRDRPRAGCCSCTVRSCTQTPVQQHITARINRHVPRSYRA